MIIIHGLYIPITAAQLLRVAHDYHIAVHCTCSSVISCVRMLTPYDLRLFPRFPNLRFSRSVVDLFSCVRSSRFSLCVRSSSFYVIAYFPLPIAALSPSSGRHSCSLCVRLSPFCSSTPLPLLALSPHVLVCFLLLYPP